MSKTHAKSGVLFFDWYPVGSGANAADVTFETEMAEDTGFTDPADTWLDGQGHAELTWGGFWDPAASGLDSNGFDHVLAGSKLWGFYPAGSAAGQIGYELPVRKKSYKVNSPVKSVIAASGMGVASGYFGRATVLGYTTRSASGSDSPILNGAPIASDERLVSVFRATSLIGAGSATVKVQSSADNVTYSDLITHAETIQTNPIAITAMASGALGWIKNVITITGTLALTYQHAFYVVKIIPS